MSAIPYFLIKNDISFYHAINRKSSYKYLRVCMKTITLLGSTSFAVLISLLILIVKNQIGFILITNLIASQIFIQILKRVVNRPRPYKILEGAIAINPPKCKYSFPSGHSSSAMIIALILSSFFPMLKWIFMLFALLVGISRVFMGCHYPSDVIVGYLISFVVFGMILY
jgi:undecaprenyl-diphosphatase